MGEVRKDYILDRYVIFSTIRKKRPDEFSKSKTIKKEKACDFCPGNENQTPPEIDRFEKNGKWKIRVFPNKFPAFSEEGDPVIRTDNRFFTFSSSFGKHEVIVETEDHSKQLGDLSVTQINDILKMYVKRINALNKIDGIKYVLIFKNEGKEAGTSRIHAHSQAIAYNKIPSVVEEEIEATKNFDTCPFCDIINIEKKSDRRVFENNSFISFTPYASRFPFEIWLFPKRHVMSITELSSSELSDLAKMLKKILTKLKKINAPYNFYLHNSPANGKLHFHIELLPRLSLWAGFELGSGDFINVVLPEEAAKFYKE